jgi:serine/threonine protein kinase/tetratricopeptide (TPR) repeat protein
MAESHDATEQTLASWNRRERIVEAFEDEWAASVDGKSPPPQLVDFLDGLDEFQRRDLLIELVRVDLEFRLKANQPVRVEDYLKDYPALSDDKAMLVELIQVEYTLRCRVDRKVTPQEYEDRFPTLHEELAPCLKGSLHGNSHASWTSPVGREDESLRTAAHSPRPTDPNLTIGEDHSTQPALPDGEPGFPTVEGYEILKALGEGGMGVVYLARHRKLDRLIALKMIRSDRRVGKRDMARFRAEAEAVARLHHANIVQIFEIGEVEGRPFFSLEYVEHGSLDGKIKRAALPAREAARLGELLARAMHHAHQHGIIHRDLKPANVLLAASDPTQGVALAQGTDGTTHFAPKIADFGLAKRLDEDSSLTQHGVVLGTPSYMAPEQIPDPADGTLKPIGPGADIYALGALLYDILVGRPPFKGATAMDTLGQVLQKDPIPLRQLQPEVHRDLETICLKCLDKSPAKRYASAMELADDLRRFINREPIRARPASAWERLSKWAARKPAVASALGIGVVALLAVLTAVGLLVKNKLDDAERAEALAKHELEVTEQVSQDIASAQKHEAVEDWKESLAELNKAQSRLDTERDLNLSALRTQVEQRRALMQQRIEGRAQAMKREAALQPPYDEVLFSQTAFTGLDAAQNREKILAAAPKALAFYGLADGKQDGARDLAVLEGDKQYLKPAEHARLAGACYELLLIWAETAASAPPGKADTDKDNQARAAAALALLDRAERLGKAYGIDTRAYHVDRAQFLAQSKGAPFDRPAAEKAAPAAQVSRLDWFHTGLELYRQHRWAEAIVACEQVLQQNEDNYWAHFVTAVCQLRLNQWLDAKDKLTTCINLRKDQVWPRVLRGFAAAEAGVRHTNKRLAEAEFAAAEKDFSTALKQDAQPLVQYAVRADRGVMQYRRGNLDEAAEDLREAIKAYPAGVQAYVSLSKVYQDQQHSNEAIDILGKAIAQAPRIAELHERRAELHYLKNAWKAAKEDFANAIDFAPKEGASKLRLNCLVKLGWLLDQESDHKGALFCFQRALAIDPAYGLAHRFRAETLLRMKQNAEAGKALDEYLATAKHVPADIYYARGLVHAQQKEMFAAIEKYTLALAEKPFDRDMLQQRGWAYLYNNISPAQALRDFDVCLAHNKGNTEALVGRGYARMVLQQLKEALSDAEASEKGGPLADRLWYHLARLYSLASVVKDADTRKGSAAQQAAATQQVVRLREKALDCLRRTMELMPQDRQSSFWREQVQNDPALAAIRGNGQYGTLALMYARKGP